MRFLIIYNFLCILFCWLYYIRFILVWRVNWSVFGVILWFLFIAIFLLLLGWVNILFQLLFHFFIYLSLLLFNFFLRDDLFFLLLIINTLVIFWVSQQLFISSLLNFIWFTFINLLFFLNHLSIYFILYRLAFKNINRWHLLDLALILFHWLLTIQFWFLHINSWEIIKIWIINHNQLLNIHLFMIHYEYWNSHYSCLLNLCYHAYIVLLVFILSHLRYRFISQNQPRIITHHLSDISYRESPNQIPLSLIWRSPSLSFYTRPLNLYQTPSSKEFKCNTFTLSFWASQLPL